MPSTHTQGGWGEAKEVVLVGGGHAHVIVLRSFGMNPLEGVNLTVICGEFDTPYSGMMPGHIAGHYTKEECHIDIVPLAKFAKARFIRAKVKGIDSEAKTVSCDDGRPPIPYDILSINIGSSPSFAMSYYSIDGTECPHVEELLKKSLTCVKPIDVLSKKWEEICDSIKLIGDSSANTHTSHSTPTHHTHTSIGKVVSTASGSYPPPYTMEFVVVGGGAAGVEVAFSAHHTLKKLLEERAVCERFKLVFKICTSGSIMESHNASVRAKVLRIMKERGIEVYENFPVKSVGVGNYSLNEMLSMKESDVSEMKRERKKSYLVCDHDKERLIYFDECLWCTQSNAAGWLKTSSSLELDKNGFIKVKKTLESTNTEGVFAVGDICSITDDPRPKAGVFAVRAGPILYRNIINKVKEKPLQVWSPQSVFLGLIGTGDKYAIASYGSFALEGGYIWKLKERIDLAFMRQFKELPSMAPPREAAHLPLVAPTRTDSPDVRLPMLGAMHRLLCVPRYVSQLMIGSCKKLLTLVDMWNLARKQNYLLDTQQPKHSIKASVDKLEKPRASIDGMYCGGCGSKASGKVLSSVTKQLISSVRRSEVILGLRALDDVSVFKSVNGSNELPLVQTMDFFTTFYEDPYIFGKIAANHALCDCFASGAEPITALALVAVPHGSERQQINELNHMMRGCLEVLEAANCELIGGHTSVSSEAAMGLTVTGRLNRLADSDSSLSSASRTHNTQAYEKENLRDAQALKDAKKNESKKKESPSSSFSFKKSIENVFSENLLQNYMNLRKFGFMGKGNYTISSGDCLILTKAIGTGVIFAAHMRNKAKGRWIYSALESMQLSNQKASDFLRTSGVKCCTDLTGFGLIGHLFEMIEASQWLMLEKCFSDEKLLSSNDGSPSSFPWLSIDLHTHSIPLLEGAKECVELGLESSLYPSNYTYSTEISNLEEAITSSGSIFPLLFDPQTSGGLLCVVEASSVESCLSGLKALGFASSSSIGTFKVKECDNQQILGDLMKLKKSGGSEGFAAKLGDLPEMLKSHGLSSISCNVCEN